MKLLSHFSVLLRSVHGHRIPHEAPAEMHIDIKSCNNPNSYDIYHTFMSLCCIVLTTCFTRSVLQKVKAPVKVNPFPVFLLYDWSGLLCTDQSISGRTSPRLHEYKTYYDMLAVQINCLF